MLALACTEREDKILINFVCLRRQNSNLTNELCKRIVFFVVHSTGNIFVLDHGQKQADKLRRIRLSDCLQNFRHKVSNQRHVGVAFCAALLDILHHRNAAAARKEIDHAIEQHFLQLELHEDL